MLLAGPQVAGQLDGRISALRCQPHPATKEATVLQEVLTALQSLLQFWLPAAFRMGYLVRSCYWECRQADTGNKAESILLQTLVLLIHLLGVKQAAINGYVRTISTALLTWQPWLNQLHGVAFVEEACEAMLFRFGHRLEINKHAHSFDDVFKRVLSHSI